MHPSHTGLNVRHASNTMPDTTVPIFLLRARLKRHTPSLGRHTVGALECYGEARWPIVSYRARNFGDRDGSYAKKVASSFHFAKMDVGTQAGSRFLFECGAQTCAADEELVRKVVKRYGPIEIQPYKALGGTHEACLFVAARGAFGALALVIPVYGRKRRLRDARIKRRVVCFRRSE